MLIGDNQGTAERIAKSLRIDRVFADVLLGDKASKVKQLQGQGKGWHGRRRRERRSGFDFRPMSASQSVLARMSRWRVPISC